MVRISKEGGGNEMSIDYSKITKVKEVISLIQQREEIERKINLLDNKALINYELEKLSEEETK